MKDKQIDDVELDNDDTIYTTMLKAMREMKIMTESSEGNKTSENDIVKDISKTFYGYEIFQQNRSNSRNKDGNNYFCNFNNHR